MNIINIEYRINEKVEYKSKYDGEWRFGIISRFSQEGFTVCASIWEKPEDGEEFCNYISLTDDCIRKINIDVNV